MLSARKWMRIFKIFKFSTCSLFNKNSKFQVSYASNNHSDSEHFLSSDTCFCNVHLRCTQSCVYPTDYLTIRCREREIKQGGEFHSKQRKHFLITSWSTPSDIKKKSTNTEDSTFDSGHRKKGTNQQCHKNGIIIFATETKKWGEGGGNQSLSIYTQKIGNDSPSQHDVQYTSHCTLSGPTFYNNSTKLPFTKRDSLRERERVSESHIPLHIMTLIIHFIPSQSCPSPSYPNTTTLSMIRYHR